MSACSSRYSNFFIVPQSKKNPQASFFPFFFFFFIFWKLSGIYFLAINTCLPKFTPSSQSASCCDGHYPYMSIWYPEDGLVEFFRRVEHKFFITHAFVSIKEQNTFPVWPVYVSMVSSSMPISAINILTENKDFQSRLHCTHGIIFLKSIVLQSTTTVILGKLWSIHLDLMLSDMH